MIWCDLDLFSSFLETVPSLGATILPWLLVWFSSSSSLRLLWFSRSLSLPPTSCSLSPSHLQSWSSYTYIIIVIIAIVFCHCHNYHRYQSITLLNFYHLQAKYHCNNHHDHHDSLPFITIIIIKTTTTTIKAIILLFIVIIIITIVIFLMWCFSQCHCIL